MKEGEKDKNILKRFLKNVSAFFCWFWFLLWKDDSLGGWIFSVVFLFIFIKLIFFPGIGFVLGTDLPLAIVESCSMHHDGNLISNYNSWWDFNEDKYEDFSLTKSLFAGFSFKRGFTKGDILIITGVKPEKVKIGDVIIFVANQKNPIIHRVVDISEINGKYFFQTIGDNNDGQLVFEKNISGDQLVGKAVFRIAPYVGWVKLIFFEMQRVPSERGVC